MKRTRVYVFTPSGESFVELLPTLLRAGYSVLSTRWTADREHRPVYLSTEQLTELADDNLSLIAQADAAVIVTDRTLRDHGGGLVYVGAAYAREIPTIVLGPYLDGGVYARRINTADGINGVLRLLKSLTPAIQQGESNVAPLVSDGPPRSDTGNRSEGAGSKGESHDS